MEKTPSFWFNVIFKTFAALVYVGMGYYVSNGMEPIGLGSFNGLDMQVALGYLFMVYGAFRLWRSWVYWKTGSDGASYGTYDEHEDDE